MTLLEQIQEKLKEVGIDHVVEQLGYKPSRSDKVKEALQTLLSASEIDIFLDQSYFDFKYDSRGLLKAVCRVLKIPKVDLAVTLEAYDDKKRRLAAMQSPYIFVYTGFKRQNQPIFALAVMESKRRIQLDKKLYLSKTKEEIDTYISHAVKLHYKWHKGELPLWGKIKAYVYYDTEGNRTVYSPLGDIIKEDEIRETRASVKIGHKTLIGI